MGSIFKSLFISVLFALISTPAGSFALQSGAGNIRETKSVVIGIFGQSFAQALYSQPAFDEFKSQLRAGGIEPQFVYWAVGGSSATKGSAPASDPNRYWWNEETNRPGPILQDAFRQIDRSPSRPQVILWLQGEQNSVRNTDAATYELATRNILWSLKKRSSETPTSVHTFMHTIGRRIAGVDLLTVQTIRDEQLRLIDHFSPHHLADTWDLPLLGDYPELNKPGDSHMTPEGNAMFAYRSAQSVLQVYGMNADPALSVVKVYSRRRANAPGSQIGLQFSSGGSRKVLKSSQVSHLALRGLGKVFDKGLQTSWEGDTLVIDIPQPLDVQGAAVEILYPYGGIPTIDRENILKDSLGTTVRSFRKKVTLPIRTTP